MRSLWSIPFLYNATFSIITILLASERAQAGSGAANIAPLPIQSTLSTNSPLPSASPAVFPSNEGLTNDDSVAQSIQTVASASNTFSSTSQTVTPIQKGAAAAQVTQAPIPTSSSSSITDSQSSAYNVSEPAQEQSGSSQTLGNCITTDPLLKPASRFRRWLTRRLKPRNCVVPIALQPATGLAPTSNIPTAVADTQQPVSSSESQSGQESGQSTPAVAGAQAVPVDTQQSQSSPAVETPQQEASAAPVAEIQPVPNDVQPSQSSPDNQAETTPLSETPATDGTQPVQADTQQSQSSQESQPEVNSGQEAPAAEAVQQTAAAPAIVPAVTSSPALLVQGQTVPNDGHAITVNNQPVRQSAGSIYVSSSAYPTPELAPASLAPAPLVAGKLTFVPATPISTPSVAPSPVVLGGLTFSAEEPKAPAATDNAAVQPQAQPIVISRKTYAPIEQQEGDVENGQSEPQDQSNNGSQISNAGSQPVIIAGQTYTPVSVTPTPGAPQVFSFGGKAVTQGGPPVTVDGIQYSLGNSAVVIGTSTIPLTSGLPIPSKVAAASVLTVGSQELTALSGGNGGFEIDHSTLLPGSSGIVVAGLTYSLNSASALIIGTSTVALATAAPGQSGNEGLTADGETFTPLGSSAVVVENQTLSAGGPALTEDGRVISLGSAGLVIGSSTFHYAAPVSVSATTSLESNVPASTSATISPVLNSTVLSASPSRSSGASASPTLPSLKANPSNGSSKSTASRGLIVPINVMMLVSAFILIPVGVAKL